MTSRVSALWVSRSLRSATLVAAVVTAFAGCSGDDGDEVAGGFGGSGSGATGSGATGSGATGSGATGSGATGSGAGGSGGGVIGSGGSGGSGAAGSGCEKIDFLFVVDNSVSMQDQQAALVAAFPGFISAIESTVKAGSNYHIMVADTDAWGRCNTANPWSGATPSHATCNSYVQQTVFEECDRVRGAGVIHPAGQHASNTKCPVPDGRRYLQQGDPNIASTFGCMAKVGVAGHASERPMEGILGAVSPQLNAVGGCNEGFLRDDALLVVTFISDDPNYEDTGTPQEWYDAVVQAKKGNPDSVVMVGITPAFAGCASGNNIKGAHWAEFVAKFKYNLHANVCTADYAATFAQAITVIDEGCDQYTPPR
ncbi:MAG: hypothetical protein KF718_00360 [Polyangiaceae bacterium]|nr:hypothetical protein [Polyangiaceae bacterium]